jgi:replication factor A1
MINVPIDLLKQKIIDHSAISPEDLDKKIRAKLEQLSGLISQEGAAHIIASELGVNLMKAEGLLKIKDLLAGMKNIEVIGKVIRKYDLKTFSNDKRSGKLARFLIGDESSTTMVVLWNDAADAVNDLNEGDVVRLRNSYVRDNTGKTEVHLSERKDLEINPAGISIDKAKSEQANSYAKATRKKISELQENDSNIEIFATVVQVFEPKFFAVDPTTGKRVKEGEMPDKVGYGAVLNIFVDDGSDNVRVVLWKNQILNLLKVDEHELMKFRDNPAIFEPVKTDMLGLMVKFIGRVTKNAMFGRLEFVANVVIRDVDPDEEIKRIDSEIKENKSTPLPKHTALEKEQKENVSKPISKEEPKKKPAVVDDNYSELDEELLSLDDLEDLEE